MTAATASTWARTGTRITRGALGAALLLACTLRAGAAELLLLTSYEEEVVAPVVAAFAERRPDIALRTLNKNTNAAVEEILAGNDRRFDLFWASAAEAFEVLDARGRLADLGRGPHADFALSAVGWTWRAPLAGPAPETWNDLLAPHLAGRVVMSHPMRSGTTHSLIETILQDRGWEPGWAWTLELAGQLNTISARSFGVLEAVEQGRADVGLTIDFLALKRSDRGLVFRYGRPIIIVPARIAALKGGEAPEAARDFIDFVLSPEGQRILLRPDIRRIPVDPEVRAELAETLFPEVRAALQFSWSRYDPRLASQRYWAVNELFEAFVGRDFLRRRDLWQRWRALAAEAEVPRADLAAIRVLLTWMPVTEHQARTAPEGRETLIAWQALAGGILDNAEAALSALENGRGRPGERGAGR